MLERSRLLEGLGLAGLVHGFTTRLGGVSKGSFASMNVTAKRGDDPESVEANLRRIAELGAFDRSELARVRQVHGSAVIHAPALEAGAEADALWVGRGERPGVVSVTTADCVPILLVDASRARVAAIHAGWRGVVARIVPEALAAMGADLASTYAAIGPCIEVGAFEVGEEVAAQFGPGFVDRDLGPKPHVDLVAAVRGQLVEAGVDAARVDRVGGCTHAHPERYFSYRRDGATTGQALSFVGFARA